MIGQTNRQTNRDYNFINIDALAKTFTLFENYISNYDNFSIVYEVRYPQVAIAETKCVLLILLNL